MEHSNLNGVLSRVLAFDTSKLPRISAAEPPKFIEDMSHADYHADKTRMSSSGIRKMLHSPRQFLKYWNGIVDKEEEEEDHFRIGRAAHLLLLEPQLFNDLYVIEPVHQGKTKDGKVTSNPNALEVKAAKAKWRSEQRTDAIIVSQGELDDLVGMVESVIEHPVANQMLKDGKPECTLHWVDQETGVACKARPDYIVRDKQVHLQLHLLDFKTARDIRAGIFASEAHRLKYGVQLAFYHDAIVAVFGEQPASITLIPVEKKSPYEAAVYPLEDSWFEDGQKQYKHALRLYRQCREANKWPAFQRNAQMLSMPHKAQYDSLPEFSFE